MKRSVAWTAFGLLAMSLLTGTLPAFAATSYVQDGASMFSSGTVQALDAQIASLNASTGKEIVIVTVPSLDNGETIATAAQTVFQEQNVNGVLIFIAKDDRKDIIVAGKTTGQFFDQATNASIRTSMESQFKDGDFDGGITTAVSGVLNVFHAHVNTNVPVQQNATNYNYPAATSSRLVTRHHGGPSMFMWLIIIVVGWLVLRSIFRAMRGPRYYGGGPMGGGYGPGYGGPGPGYGYGGPGYYGGGGGFWSGLLGGLGGAWLGNEMFGNQGNTTIIEQGGGNVVPTDQGGGWGGGNPGGWGNDGGQADMGNASSGDFSGGGFGDFGGGGGGGDFGGGGGDSGGGW